MANTDNAPAGGPHGEYPFAISFIDPLFAVAMDMGLSGGVLQEQWAKQGHWPGTADDWFHCATFCVGLLAVIVGWIGYHHSLKTKPIRAPLRFFIDVMLVLMYGLILFQFRNLEAVLILFTAVFLLYLFWDLVKVLEHPDRFPNTSPWQRRYRREFVTAFWFLVYWALCVARFSWDLNRWATLSFIGAACVLYRLNKGHEFWAGLWRFIRQGSIGR